MDKYGNPIQHHTGGVAPTDAGYGADTDGGFDAATTGTTGYAGTDGGQQQQRRPDPKDHNNAPGTLNRSGSSSSSEDDEQGGRRKKGLTQKIKEKLPGGHLTEEEQYRNQVAAETKGTGTNTAAHGYGQGGAVREPEKKGMMEKVREQIPGGNKTSGNKSDEERRHQVATGTTGTGTNTAAHGYGQGVAVHEPEKKGLMEKVKENIPCGNKTEEHGHPVATGTGTGTNTGAQGISQGGAVHEPEKKGLMEKVKENIPCGNKTEEHGHPVATGTTGTGTGTNTGANGIGQGGAVHEPEKKEGIMQKIKEKLAGQH